MSRPTTNPKVNSDLLLFQLMSKNAQSWASLTSEQDLDDLIPESVRSEVFQNNTVCTGSTTIVPSRPTLRCEGDSDFLRPLPESIKTQADAGDSPRALNEPIFGFTESPFAVSPEQIRSLDSLFDGYISPDHYEPQADLLSPFRLALEIECKRKQLEAQQRHALQYIPALHPGYSTVLPASPPSESTHTCPTNALASACLPSASEHTVKATGDVEQCRSSGLGNEAPSLQSVQSISPPKQNSKTPCRWEHKPKNDETCRTRSKQKTGFLTAFKQRSGNGYRLSDLWGHMIFLSQDQIGSRFLQKELPTASASEQQRYFQEISQQALTIASDVFGNFIIQVLLESNNPVISRKLVEIIKSHMMDLSTRPYGCRVVQKAIETLPYDGKKYLAASLEGNVESCAHNEHGNHVLQRCLHHIQAQDIAFAYSTIADRTRTMSKDRYGCRVVQRAIENGDSGKLTDPIRRRIVIHAVEFASDEFANFVVQKLLLTGTPPTVERMAVSFMPHLRWLSCQKYPSNVVETLLSVCSLQTALRIKLNILGTEERHSDVPLTSLMRDRFGRYVLEKLIKFCTPFERTMIKNTAQYLLLSVRGDARQRSLTRRLHRLLDQL